MQGGQIFERTILIVDDDPLLCRQMHRLLQECYSVESCGSAADARAYLAQRRFDLVIADWNMPIETGVSLLSFIAKAFPDTRRVLMTGVLDPVLPLDPGDRTLILFKPFSGPEVRSAVGNILAGKSPRSEHVEV